MNTPLSRYDKITAEQLQYLKVFDKEPRRSFQVADGPVVYLSDLIDLALKGLAVSEKQVSPLYVMPDDAPHGTVPRPAEVSVIYGSHDDKPSAFPARDLKVQINKILHNALSGRKAEYLTEDKFTRWGLVEKDMHDAIDAAFATSATQPTIPGAISPSAQDIGQSAPPAIEPSNDQGWKMVKVVPVTPTQEMLEAAGHACDGMNLSKMTRIQRSHFKAKVRWAAMLKAALPAMTSPS